MILTASDIDAADLDGLPARHYPPELSAILGPVVSAQRDRDTGEWMVAIAEANRAVVGIDLDGAAIRAAGASCWQPGQLVRAVYGDWHGRGWAAAMRGITTNDVLALPEDADAAPRLITAVELLVTT